MGEYQAEIEAFANQQAHGVPGGLYTNGRELFFGDGKIAFFNRDQVGRCILVGPRVGPEKNTVLRLRRYLIHEGYERDKGYAGSSFWTCYRLTRRAEKPNTNRDAVSIENSGPQVASAADERMIEAIGEKVSEIVNLQGYSLTFGGRQCVIIVHSKFFNDAIRTAMVNQRKQERDG